MTDDQAIHILTALFLGLVAHRLTIGRDKRREFNEIVVPLRDKIRREARDPSPSVIAISRDEADAVFIRLWRPKRDRFMECCERYWDEHSKQNQDSIGQPGFEEPERIKERLSELLKYIRPH